MSKFKQFERPLSIIKGGKGDRPQVKPEDFRPDAEHLVIVGNDGLTLHRIPRTPSKETKL